jgi:hypothetical protein
MSAQRRFWSSLAAVLRQPLIRQPFTIAGFAVTALAWVVVASAAWLMRLAAVVAGELAFVGGICLCLVGLSYIGAPLGLAGLVASRVAA